MNNVVLSQRASLPNRQLRNQKTMTSNEFKVARLKLGLTQESLANKLEISRVIVGLMERNQAPITKRTELSMLYLLIQLKNST